MNNVNFQSFEILTELWCGIFSCDITLNTLGLNKNHIETFENHVCTRHKTSSFAPCSVEPDKRWSCSSCFLHPPYWNEIIHQAQHQECHWKLFWCLFQDFQTERRKYSTKKDLIKNALLWWSHIWDRSKCSQHRKVSSAHPGSGTLPRDNPWSPLWWHQQTWEKSALHNWRGTRLQAGSLVWGFYSHTRRLPWNEDIK